MMIKYPGRKENLRNRNDDGLLAMFKNRIFSRRFEYPQPAAQAWTAPAGFAMVAMAVAGPQLAWQQQIYRQAYEQARRNAVPFYMQELLGTGN
jgi:hypothetical protein